MSYKMERDSRRDRGQWKGCYSFKDITCDDDRGVGPGRDGGLKMGNTYHYYYELDGSHETHDHTRPSTRHCPYMPGQTVNTLSVPVQHTFRKRRASVSSMCTADFMTMNPSDKYASPQPPPCAPLPPATPATAAPALPRFGSSPRLLSHRSSARSLSPSPSWRRFFRRAHGGHERHERAPTPDTSALSLEETAEGADYGERNDARSRRSSGSGTRSRDISPESLRRFLVDDADPPQDPREDGPAIPEDIPEEAEDDDNFATSAATASAAAAAPYPTVLAPPPPFRRTASAPAPAGSRAPEESPVFPDLANRSRFSFSSISSYGSSSACEWPLGGGQAPPTLYDLRAGVAAGSKGSKGVGGLQAQLVDQLGWMVDIIKG